MASGSKSLLQIDEEIDVLRRSERIKNKLNSSEPNLTELKELKKSAGTGEASKDMPSLNAKNRKNPLIKSLSADDAAAYREKTEICHGEEFNDPHCLRRSHRIGHRCTKPQAQVGEGLLSEKERYAYEKLITVQEVNEIFLESPENSGNCKLIKQNIYIGKCGRLSEKAEALHCDCFLTAVEIARGELGCGEDCLNRHSLVECENNCNLKERCTNKRFQKFLCLPCRVFQTKLKGLGLMSVNEILAGEFIIEFVGEVVNNDEFKKRKIKYTLNNNNNNYFMAADCNKVIDSTFKGNISRFINHSCDPNAHIQKWIVSGELRLGIFSLKNILPNEEITVDYNYNGEESHPCYCEAANCNGFIGGKPCTDECKNVDDELQNELETSAGTVKP